MADMSELREKLEAPEELNASELIAVAVKAHWGGRCVTEFSPECPTCRAWARLDELDRVEKERDEARAEYASVADFFPAHNRVMNEVWDVLGREPHREGGEHFLGRVKELQSRAEAAEGLIEQAVRALERIERWSGEFPETGQFWDRDEKEPMSYRACFGTDGERDFMREIARSTLSLLKASRPQNREETDAENERIS